MDRTGWLGGMPVAIIGGAAVVAMGLYLLPEPLPGDEALPAFPELPPKSRKLAFFDYLRPIVRVENARIAADRDWLAGMVAPGVTPSWWQRRRLAALAREYRVDLAEPDALQTLWRRVDAVPESLVLVQAAKESGWGRSRFAREGNALFGERCFQAGCGMMPKARVAGLRHEVETFDTVRDAVASYLNNINSHDRYRELRHVREQLRSRGEPVTGTALVAYVLAYSERRDDYVREVLAMIRRNRLEADDL